MRALLFLAVLLVSSVIAGVAIGRFTVSGAAFAVAPGPEMPHSVWVEPDASSH